MYIYNQLLYLLWRVVLLEGKHLMHLVQVVVVGSFLKNCVCHQAVLVGLRQNVTNQRTLNSKDVPEKWHFTNTIPIKIALHTKSCELVYLRFLGL